MRKCLRLATVALLAWAPAAFAGEPVIEWLDFGEVPGHGSHSFCGGSMPLVGAPTNLTLLDGTHLDPGPYPGWTELDANVSSELVDGDAMHLVFEPLDAGVLYEHFDMFGPTGASGRLGFTGAPVVTAQIGSTVGSFSGFAEVLDLGPFQCDVCYAAERGTTVPFQIALVLEWGATWQPGLADLCPSYRVRGRVHFPPAPPPLVATPNGASFELLGDLPDGAFWSSALGVSADGSVVVGFGSAAGNVTTATRWTNGAMAPIGVPPGMSTSVATDVSSDGAAVLVNATGSNGVSSRSYVWRAATGFQDLGVAPGSWYTNGASISADGFVVAGTSSDPEGGAEAFVWRDGVFTQLGVLPGGSWSRATGVSADGSVVVGYGQSERAPVDEFEAFVWTAATGLVGLGAFPGGDGASRANAVSDDGRVVVGASSSPSHSLRAFRWTAESGLVDLCGADPKCGGVQGGFEALAVSADGSVISGEAYFGGFVWDEAHGVRELLPLYRRWLLDPPPFTYLSYPIVSGDGRSIVGQQGRDEFGHPLGWRATLVGACADGSDDDADGFIDAADPGCSNASDVSEQSDELPCDDGRDNDGDGFSDRFDPGCPYPHSPREDPACDNGLDDDGDGKIDGEDPQCSPEWPASEHGRGCGLGAELALALWVLRARASTATRARRCRNSSSTPTRGRAGTS